MSVIDKRRGGWLIGLAFLLVSGAGSLALGQPLQQWAAYFDDGLGYQDLATAMTTDNHNNVIVTGCSQPNGVQPYDIVTIMYNPNDGSQVWERRYGTPNMYDTAVAVKVDGADNIYVAGSSQNPSGRYDVVLLKYRTNGDSAFVQRFEDPAGQLLTGGMGLDGGGNVYIGALHRADSSGNTKYDLALIKYDSTGNLIWSRYTPMLVNNPSLLDMMVSVCVDSSGNAIITGPTKDTTPGAVGQDFVTVKYNPNGDTTWTRQFDGGVHWDDYPVSIKSDDSGNVYVLGASDAGYGNYNYSVVKYDRAGGFHFHASYDYRDNPGCWDIPVSFAIDARHAIYVTGSIENYDDYDIGTIKFSPLGDTVWSDIWNGGSGDDAAASILVDGFGNTFVGGTSTGTNFDFVTLKYDAAGVRNWVVRWVNPADDDAEMQAMAMDNLHNLYVCGFAYGANTLRDYVTIKYSGPDAGVTQILAPVDTVRVNRKLTPQVMVKNYSPISITCPVRIEASNGFYGVAMITSLAAYESTLVTFPQFWMFTDSGNFSMKAYTQLTGDEEPHDDTAYGHVVATFPWLTKPVVPFGAKNRKVKDGASLAFFPDSNRIYCIKGNNTLEFYMFNCSSEVWVTRESVPSGTGKKKVKKGAALAYGGNSLLYAFKGGRTAEFWTYDARVNLWFQKPNLPGTIKEGGCMTYVPTHNWLYVLQGSNFQNFWAFDLTGDTWINRSPIPLGISNKKPKDGSSMAYDGLSDLYVIKGKTQDFFKYNVNSDSWTQLKSLPLIGQSSKKKKNGSGGSMAYADGRIYTLKGNNTNEFWAYYPPLDSWTESDSMLSGGSKKRVKGGASMATAFNKIYATKGNNTFEFYLYNADIPFSLLGSTSKSGPQSAGAAGGLQFALALAPNPFRDVAMVTYSLPEPGDVSLKLYGVTGRLCANLVAGRQHAGIYHLPLSNRNLASGVYFLKARFDNGVRERELNAKVLIDR